MILFFQLPLTDIRGFINGNTGKIPVPLWPHPIFSASNSKQVSFVRQFGKIKPRKKGGVQGWLGEDEICEAKSAIRIQKIEPYKPVFGHPIHIQGRSRHFFFDGQAVGKYEFVFVTTKPAIMPDFELPEFIDYFLNIQVYPANDRTLVTPLHLSGKNLAKEYLISTTKSKSFRKIISKNWVKRTKDNWVNSGSPMLFIECSSKDKIFLNKIEKEAQVKKVQLPPEYNADLFHILYPIDEFFIRVWLLKRKDDIKSEKLRTLRLYIMRLNAEYESIKYVLSQIETENITYTREKESALEAYLNNATRHIVKIENSTKKIAETDEIEDLSKSSFDKVYPGSSDSILTKIKNIRPQVYKKVETLVQEIYNIQGDFTMGDKINLNGDFRGANVNVKSILQDVAINIQNAVNFDQSTKKEIEDLIKRLEGELKKAPPPQKDEAQAVSTMAKRLIETATQEKPNKTEVKISAEGLMKAAQNVAKVMPIVLVVAKQLISLVIK